MILYLEFFPNTIFATVAIISDLPSPSKPRYNYRLYAKGFLILLMYLFLINSWFIMPNNTDLKKNLKESNFSI